MTHTLNIEELRQHEFGRLASTRSVYLDYTGAALYPASLIANDACRLTTQVMGNPHSDSAPSIASSEAIEKARCLTLRLLDADPAVYDVIFTANASAAMRIVADGFAFQKGGRLVLTADNHNSMNGLRMAALRRRATVGYVPLDAELRSLSPSAWLAPVSVPSLFGFPAQSNFSGVRHPLNWIAEAQSNGYQVMLDAAAYLPTNRLSLRQTPADFVALSFYKLFGYPTGIGALIARREALSKLRKRAFFGGGAVQFVSVQNNLVRLKAGPEGHEDGTPNFLAMHAVCDGLNWLHRVGVTHIGEHVTRLTGDMLQRFADLGDRVILYGPRDMEQRGGVVTFNLRRLNGQLLPFEVVEAAARDRGIAIRGGCFCNPGAAEQAFKVPARLARACLRGSFTIPRFRQCLNGQPVGALRASVGIATDRADIEALLNLAANVIDS